MSNINCQNDINVQSDEIKWKSEQIELSKKVLKQDNNDLSLQNLKLVGGLDISFVKGSKDACISLVVLQLPSLKVIYEDSKLIKMCTAYVSGYLGFREVDFFRGAISTLLQKAPKFYPPVVLVDGNGLLHPRQCGSASHLGVTSDIATIGVAKTLCEIPDEGILKDEEHKRKISALLKKKGDRFELVSTSSNIVLGMAVRTSNEATTPVYVSIGHKCSLENAVEVVVKCSKYKVPEPIRQADIKSRKTLDRET